MDYKYWGAVMITTERVVPRVLMALNAQDALPPMGAAPKGDASMVASRIIKNNFPACEGAFNAKRLSDGSIRARCDGIDYLVFTLFDGNDGEVREVALNCTAAKAILSRPC
jgi:hypothetical protein